MDYLEVAINEVIELFPDKVKSGALYQNYPTYLFILKHIYLFLKQNLDRNKELKILDVGAGAGIISLALGKMGHYVYAIDTWKEHSKAYDNKMGVKEDIIKRLETNGVQTKYCNIEKEPFPFDDCNFNIVLFLDVLEHLHSSPKGVLKEIRRVLKPNGVLVITTPNLFTLRNRFHALFGRSIHTELNYWYNSEPFFGHIREYTVGEVKKMLGWAGFDTKHVGLSNCRQTFALKDFKLKPYTLVMMFYLLITMLIPKFRYLMIIAGSKK